MRQPRLEIHPETFEGLLSLKAHGITYCDLQNMPPLNHISHSLETFDLSWNNIFDQQVILNHEYSHLSLLSLRGNRLTSVPYVKEVATNLQTLDLSDNSIKSLDNLYDVQFYKLSTLDLSSNLLRHISFSGLDMPKLDALYLQHNFLVSMEPVDEILNGFSASCYQLFVSIRHNPWHCNESLSWLYNSEHYEQAHKGFSILYLSPSCKVCLPDIHSLLCHTPAEFRGKPITSLGKLFVIDVISAVGAGI